MEKKVRYPIEAFALAMVLFSTEMKTAMLVGMALVFGDVLACFLREAFPKLSSSAAAGAAPALTVAAAAVMLEQAGLAPASTMDWLKLVFTAGLLAKHCGDNEDIREFGYGDMLFADSIAYGALVLLAVLREYLAHGEIFGYELAECPVGTAVIGKPMFALIGAGLMTALVNRILKTASTENAALVVCLPVLVLEVPFVWNHVPEIVGTVVGIVMAGVLYLTVRKKLAFSDTLPHIAGVPVELTLLGMLYMVVTIL